MKNFTPINLISFYKGFSFAKATLVLCLTFSFGRTEAQTTISASDITLSASSTPMSVAWHPGYSRYYASAGGGSNSPVTTFSSSGAFIASSTHNFDNRGLWYNSTNSRLEGNDIGTSSVGYYPMDGSGNLSGNVVATAYGFPGGQLGGIRNSNNGEILFYAGSTSFSRYNSSGSSLGTVNITIPGGVTFNSTHMIYTGISGQEVGFYDATNRIVYLYSISGGSYTYYYTLPASAPAPGSYGFAYANGRFFLSTNGTWYGYPASASIAPANPTSVTASYNILCNGASTTLTANGAEGTVHWYTGSCGGTATSPATGNTLTVTPSTTTTYYARNYNNSQFSAGCASINIVVNPRPTVANLQATGTGIKWYSAATEGTELATSTQLQNNTYYYASQTVNGIESTQRLAVLVTMTNP